MHHHQRSRQRHTQVQQVDPSLTGNHINQRDQQHKSHLEEHRNPGDKTHQHHRPRGVLLTQQPQQRGRNALGAARLLQQLAENTAQPNDAGEKPERAAHALLKCRDNRGGSHARADPHQQTGGDQGQERMHTAFTDQHDNQQNGRAKDQ